MIKRLKKLAAMPAAGGTAAAGGFLRFGGIAGVVTGRRQTVVGVLVGSAVLHVLLTILYRYTDQDSDQY
ncbi:hypothetical protein ACFV9W_18500 [Streptomyces sp. NPDC059897]|uniref:hypothetical protein n=1 Tax=Streptomyces sp. NPDC059897 TaxID=3346994 RepID=UPI00365CBBAE